MRAVGVDEKAWLATAAGKGLPALPTHVPMLSLTAIGQRLSGSEKIKEIQNTLDDLAAKK